MPDPTPSTPTPPAPGTSPVETPAPAAPAAETVSPGAGLYAETPAGGATTGGDSNSGNDSQSAAGGDSLAGDTAAGAATGSDTATAPDNKDPAGAAGEDAVPVTAADLSLPEGFEPNPEVLGNFATLATEAGLTKERAQSLLDLHAAEVKKLDEANGQAWLDTVNSWRDTVLKDKELGGNNFKAVETRIGRALDLYGSAEAREAFNATGAGWHPEIVRFVNKMAEALDEGTSLPPGDPAPRGATTPGARLYGDSPTK